MHTIRRIGTIAGIVAAIALLGGTPVQSQTPTAGQLGRVVQPVQVSIVDHTHGQWAGLQAAVTGWNRSPYVHLSIVDTCTPGAYCAVMVTGNYGPTTWGAETIPPTMIRHTVVRLNLYTLPRSFPTPAHQTAVMCHELGHVLGVDHPGKDADPETWGCIAAPNPVHVTQVASDADLLALAIARNSGHNGWGAVSGGTLQ